MEVNEREIRVYGKLGFMGSKSDSNLLSFLLSLPLNLVTRFLGV